MRAGPGKSKRRRAISGSCISTVFEVSQSSSLAGSSIKPGFVTNFQHLMGPDRTLDRNDLLNTNVCSISLISNSMLPHLHRFDPSRSARPPLRESESPRRRFGLLRPGLDEFSRQPSERMEFHTSEFGEADRRRQRGPYFRCRFRSLEHPEHRSPGSPLYEAQSSAPYSWLSIAAPFGFEPWWEVWECLPSSAGDR